MLKNITSFIIKNRFFVILLIVLITAFLAFQITNLKIVINPNTMLPLKHPNVIGSNIAESLFGSKHVVVVGVSAHNGSNVMNSEILTVVSRLSTKLADIPGVKRHTLMSVTAEKAKSISGFQDEMQVEPMLNKIINADTISELKKKLADNPMYQRILLSNDERVAAISFAINAGKKGFREIMDEVQHIADQERNSAIKISISGTPAFFATVERFAQRMAVLFPIAIIIIGLIHFEAFRTMQGLFLPLVTAILAVVWGLGIMSFSKVPMDAFNATTPILILAVAAGHAVQVLKRYYEEYDRIMLENPDNVPIIANEKAIVESVTTVGPIMITAGLVAALGFFSLIIFDIATIRTFGIFTGIGILSALLLELTFIPALRSYLKPPLSVQKDQKKWWDRFSEMLATVVLVYKKEIIIGFLLISLFSSIGMLFINRENSTKSYFGEQISVRQEDRFLNSTLAGTNTLYVVFQGNSPDRMKDPSILNLIENTQRYIEKLSDVGKTVSIVDFIKQMNRSMRGGSILFNILPDSQNLVSQYLLLYSMSGQPTDFDSYIDYNYQNANLIVWMKNDSSKYAESVVSNIRKYVKDKFPSDIKVHIGGSVPQASALSDTLVRGKMLNIGQMILVVFIAGLVIFRSVAAGIYLIIPLIVTVLVNFGIMGLTGIPLNTPNSVSSAMAIGIGADYAIYILYRMREELCRLNDFDIALRETLRTAGKAVIYVASAIVGGYSVLMLSFNFYVHIWFGVLIMISMIVSALSALILMPALLKFFMPNFIIYRKNQKGRVTSATILLFTLIAVCVAIPNAMAEEIKVNPIMEKNYQVTRMEKSLFEATFRLISESGQERVRTIFGGTKLQNNDIDNQRVIRFLSPSDVRNTTTLMIEHTAKEDEIFIYLPALKKVRRLASNNKKNSFVGTDLTFGDLVGHKPQDWEHVLLRQETYKNIPIYVIESLPKSAKIAEDTGYSKRISWIDKENFVSRKVDFFDPAGVLLKTVENTNFKLVNSTQKKWQPMLVKVKNYQTGHRTIMQMNKFDTNLDVSDDYFSVRYLEKEE